MPEALHKAFEVASKLPDRPDDAYAAGFYARMGARQTGTLAAPVAGNPSRALPVFEVEVSDPLS